jgi:hypothetical protein
MIEVFKGNIVGPEAEQIMQAAQGEFPMEFIAKEQQKYMQQPKASGGVPDIQIMPPTTPMQVPEIKRMPPTTPMQVPQENFNQNVMRQQSTQPSMRNVFEKDRERMLTMATMDKLGLLT